MVLQFGARRDVWLPDREHSRLGGGAGSPQRDLQVQGGAPVEIRGRPEDANRRRVHILASQSERWSSAWVDPGVATKSSSTAKSDEHTDFGLGGLKVKGKQKNLGSNFGHKVIAYRSPYRSMPRSKLKYFGGIPHDQCIL